MNNGMIKGLGFAGALVAAIGCGSRQSARCKPAQSGTTAPAKASVAWVSSLDQAKQIAAREHRLILVDFYADWCGPCQLMLQTTYRDPRVIQISKRFVAVKINVDEQPQIATSYGIDSLPTLAFLNATGKPLDGVIGYVPADDFLKETQGALKEFGSSTQGGMAPRSSQRPGARAEAPSAGKA